MLLFHSFGVSIFSTVELKIPAAAMQPPSRPGFGYAFPFARSVGGLDLVKEPHQLTNDGNHPAPTAQRQESPKRGARWTHEPAHAVFNATDNTDPRTGRSYTLSFPLFYTTMAGLLAALGCRTSRFTGSTSRTAPSAPVPAQRWRWHLGAALLLFVVGLYFNTGTLAPYSNTSVPYLDNTTG